MAVERCDSCDHVMTSHGAGGCRRKILETRLGVIACACSASPPPPRCKAEEGATGIRCDSDAGHAGDHAGTHIPRTDGTESVGYRLFVRWPYTKWDTEAGIKPSE